MVGTGSWRERAACWDSVDPRFFPERGESNREAKAICFDCPVQEECLNEGVVGNHRSGIWGGTSERERQVIRKRRREEQVSRAKATKT